MTRTKSPSPATIRVIPDDAVLRLDELRQILNVGRTSLLREKRRGRLKVSKRLGHYWTTGRWVRAWIEGGMVAPKARHEGSGVGH